MGTSDILIKIKLPPTPASDTLPEAAPAVPSFNPCSPGIKGANPERLPFHSISAPKKTSGWQVILCGKNQQRQGYSRASTQCPVNLLACPPTSLPSKHVFCMTWKNPNHSWLAPELVERLIFLKVNPPLLGLPQQAQLPAQIRSQWVTHVKYKKMCPPQWHFPPFYTTATCVVSSAQVPMDCLDVQRNKMEENAFPPNLHDISCVVQCKIEENASPPHLLFNFNESQVEKEEKGREALRKQ